MLLKKLILLFLGYGIIQACIGGVFAQPKSDSLLSNILYKINNLNTKKILQDPMGYRCQIIYTQIDRDKNNIPHFTNHYFNVDPNLYFNPASMVKMPLAFLSLEKLLEIIWN